MNVLVTAGNTLTLIDQVRGITNVFTGRTGARIARAAAQRGHTVALLTSRPEALLGPPSGLTVGSYKTFDELADLLERSVSAGGFDAIIHSAAVSDYRPAGVYTAARQPLPTAGKVKSDEPELWLRLVRTPKLIDRFRRDWGFRGVLVKFKLEVGITDQELLMVAESSRRQSSADLMVANTLEGAADWAYLGPLVGEYRRIARSELAERLLDAVEAKCAGAQGCG